MKRRRRFRRQEFSIGVLNVAPRNVTLYSSRRVHAISRSKMDSPLFTAALVALGLFLFCILFLVYLVARELTKPMPTQGTPKTLPNGMQISQWQVGRPLVPFHRRAPLQIPPTLHRTPSRTSSSRRSLETRRPTRLVASNLVQGRLSSTRVPTSACLRCLQRSSAVATRASSASSPCRRRSAYFHRTHPLRVRGHTWRNSSQRRGRNCPSGPSTWGCLTLVRGRAGSVSRRPACPHASFAPPASGVQPRTSSSSTTLTFRSGPRPTPSLLPSGGTASQRTSCASHGEGGTECAAEPL